MSRARSYVLAAAVGASTAAARACGRGDAGVARDARRPAAAVVDSALPAAETLRRFREGLDSVATLDPGAAPSRDALIDRFVRALASRDTAALHAMALSPAEFAWLYYPSTIYVRPPYLTPPDVLWQLMAARSGAGLRRAVERVGGAPLRLVGYECDATPKVEGANRFHENCTLRYRRGSGGEVERRRLFGSIVERDGRFKFVSYANDF